MLALLILKSFIKLFMHITHYLTTLYELNYLMFRNGLPGL